MKKCYILCILVTLSLTMLIGCLNVVSLLTAVLCTVAINVIIFTLFHFVVTVDFVLLVATCIPFIKPPLCLANLSSLLIAIAFSPFLRNFVIFFLKTVVYLIAFFLRSVASFFVRFIKSINLNCLLPALSVLCIPSVDL